LKDDAMKLEKRESILNRFAPFLYGYGTAPD